MSPVAAPGHRPRRAGPGPASALAALQREHARALLAGGPAPAPAPSQPPASPMDMFCKPSPRSDLLRCQSPRCSAVAPMSIPENPMLSFEARMAVVSPFPPHSTRTPGGWSPFDGPLWL
eukprot:EG_transcript_36292